MAASDRAQFIVAMTTLPDGASAKTFVRSLIDRRVIACGTVIDPVTSIYRWEGAVEESTEAQVLIKTRYERFASLEQAVRELHPYEVPELLAIPVADGSSDYLDWIQLETGAEEAA